jgi:hypothetical protein
MSKPNNCIKLNLEQLTKIYNIGYAAGHNDTVENCFTDVCYQDAGEYHQDVVEEIIEDIEDHNAIPEGYALVPVADNYADKGAAQKAFWHALEFCNDQDDRNIRKHWDNYKAGVLGL